MRILLAPHGTRGDVQPMLALAAAARARGDDVRFVAPDNFVAWIERHGFPCEPDGIDLEALLRTPGTDLQSLRWQHAHLTTTMIPRLFDSVRRAAACAPDVIVGAGVQVAGGSIAESIGVPYVSAIFCPCAVPTAAAPPPWVRTQRLPGWINRLLWRVGGRLADRVLRPPLDRARTVIGLPPAGNVLDLLTGRATILAADRDLGPRPPDAPPCLVATDAWVLDEPVAVSPEVDAFLRSGPPPMYVGFGSMVTGRAPGELAGHIARAANAMNCRLLVAGGWASLDRELAAVPGVLAVGDLDHHRILPRVAAAIHHGGAGTTLAAARAGIPQVIAPHILDQFYWGRRVDALGIGPAPLPIDRLDAATLIDRLRAVLSDGAFAGRARELARRVAPRNGVIRGADLLADLVARTHR